MSKKNASKFCVAGHKKRQTLPQKFKQTSKLCHTDLSLSYFAISCHTERSEVSINLKCKLHL